VYREVVNAVVIQRVVLVRKSNRGAFSGLQNPVFRVHFERLELVNDAVFHQLRFVRLALI